MENELEKKLEIMDKKIDEMHISVEKTRKYFLWTLIATAIVVILPIIGLMFAIPSFLSTYNSIDTLSGL